MGQVIRFSPAGEVTWAASAFADVLVLSIAGGSVRGLTRAGAPIAIPETSIGRAQTIDPGPYGPPDPHVRTYFGQPAQRNAAFAQEAGMLRDLGYEPAIQTVNDGSWGGGTILLAILLCIVLVGILILIWILMAKPEGSLTVTYRQVARVITPPAEWTKVCPRCAETIKAAAIACRFCGYEPQVA